MSRFIGSENFSQDRLRLSQNFFPFFLPAGNKVRPFRVEPSERKFDEGLRLNEVDDPSIQ